MALVGARSQMPREDKIQMYNAFSYDIRNEIGRGSYGRVYEGIFGSNVNTTKIGNFRCVSGERFAVKYVFLPDVPQIDRYTEVNTLTTLNNQYIIYVFNVITFETKRLYLFMEFADKGNLFTYLNQIRQNRHNGSENHSISEYDSRKWSKQMLYALQYLNKNNLAHCDIHLANILLKTDQKTRKVVAKVSDFGFAKVATLQLIMEDIRDLALRVFEDLFNLTKFSSDQSSINAADLVYGMQNNTHQSFVKYRTIDGCLKHKMFNSGIFKSLIHI